eukprot:m.28298 g.28298  ORF g.28298 m.28298 type:complete len:195 (-) comp7990_c0_seq2:69-653(-)
MDAAKKLMRQKIKGLLKPLTETDRAQKSAVVTSKILAHPKYKEASHLALFISMKDEVDTTAIFTDAFKQNKICFVPRYTQDNMDMYRVHSLEDIATLPKTKWNIAQPEDVEKRENAMDLEQSMELILVPGLAFTKDGKRLGRGKGYYDNYLRKYIDHFEGRGAPYTIGIGFDFQCVDEDIPMSDHDFILDDVLC